MIFPKIPNFISKTGLPKLSINHIILIVLLFTTGIQQCRVSKQNKQIQTLTQISNSISALTSEVKQVKKTDSLVIYQKEVAVANPNTILKSDLYKTLDIQTQQYVKELSKVKNLLAATEIQLSKQDSILQVLAYSDNVQVSDSNIVFEPSTVLAFSGTQNNLQYESSVVISDSAHFSLKYKYLLNIDTQFTTTKKPKTTVVTYKIDDPDVVLQTVNSFVVPQHKPKLQKFKKVVHIIIPSAALAVGGYLGYKIGSK